MVNIASETCKCAQQPCRRLQFSRQAPVDSNSAASDYVDDAEQYFIIVYLCSLPVQSTSVVDKVYSYNLLCGAVWDCIAGSVHHIG